MGGWGRIVIVFHCGVVEGIEAPIFSVVHNGSFLSFNITHYIQILLRLEMLERRWRWVSGVIREMKPRSHFRAVDSTEFPTLSQTTGSGFAHISLFYWRRSHCLCLSNSTRLEDGDYMEYIYFFPLNGFYVDTGVDLLWDFGADDWRQFSWKILGDSVFSRVGCVRVGGRRCWEVSTFRSLVSSQEVSMSLLPRLQHTRLLRSVSHVVFLVVQTSKLPPWKCFYLSIGVWPICQTPDYIVWY